MINLPQLRTASCQLNAILLAFLCFFSSPLFASAPPAKTIAITQIVSHASLDRVRQGIIDELAISHYPHKILFKNAEGNMVVAAQIAAQFVAKKPDVLVAIATPSAQTIAQAAKNTSIPIVFATITDPIQAKLVSDLKHPNGNITGTRNRAAIAKQLALIKNILPAVKTIGIIINPGEENSNLLLKEVIETAKKLNITIKTASVSHGGDVPIATNHLASQIDALYLIQDNTIASSLPAILKIAQKNKLPVFAMYLDAVKMGALFGLAYDEYEIGKQTGQIILQILNGKKPKDIPVTDPTHLELAINLQTAKTLNLTIDKKLVNSAKFIY